MGKFNGYPSWNSWNVSLWINNDEKLYYWAYSLAFENGIGKAVQILTRELRGQKTPDGATYNKTGIRAALKEIL